MFVLPNQKSVNRGKRERGEGREKREERRGGERGGESRREMEKKGERHDVFSKKNCFATWSLLKHLSKYNHNFVKSNKYK